jgi:hypothetical protein
MAALTRPQSSFGRQSVNRMPKCTSSSSVLSPLSSSSCPLLSCPRALVPVPFPSLSLRLFPLALCPWDDESARTGMTRDDDSKQLFSIQEYVQLTLSSTMQALSEVVANSSYGTASYIR